MSRTTLALLLATAIIAPLKAQVGNAKDEKPAPSLTSDQERNIEAYISLMRADLRKEKARVMGQVMDLDSEQSSKFWPIYLDFEKELTRFYDDVADAIKDYSARFETLTDNDADHLATLVLNLEQRRNDLKRTYYEKFKAALDPVVAMKFLQIENQIERIIDLQIASGLPIAERGQQ